MAATDSKRLMRAAHQGDVEAFASIFESLRGRVFAMACRMVGESEAEDVVMTTYLKAWEALPGFQGRSALSSWLYRIAYNCALDTIRKRGRHPEVAFVGAATTGEHEDGIDALPDIEDRHPGHAMERDELRAMLEEGLRIIGPIHRTVLELRYTDGLSYKEIAAVTGVSVGTVMSRLFHAKRRLRQAIAVDVHVAATGDAASQL